MENETINNLINRRSIRSFLDKPVEEDKIDLITKAGEYAPTGMNRQSPQIVVIENKETRSILSKMNAEVMGRDGDPYYGAPIIILVLADPSFKTYLEDGSLVLGNMMNAAHALGLGSVWINREKEMFETDKGKKLLKEWGLSISLAGVGAIALGYIKGDYPLAKERKPNYTIKVK